MPTIEQNLDTWDRVYDWTGGGDEWSSAWGTVDAHWYFTILPRIHRFVPADTILEIAPGFGRWTQYLAPLCGKLVAVDLSGKCIEHCREKFKAYQHLAFYANDGKSLAMVADGSVDFAFSFDSLVHAEEDVVEAYVGQLAKKLKPDGTAFIHHSNAGSYERYRVACGRLPNKIRKLLFRWNVLENFDRHQRARSMTAEKFRRFAQDAGFGHIAQEVINYDTSRSLIDCISVLGKRAPGAAGSCRVVRNSGFVREAASARALSRLYDMRK
jgi:SAM-dependent methyltransferase